MSDVLKPTLAIIEQLTPIPRGGILYDASRLRKPDATWFDVEHWRGQNAAMEFAGGRGAVALLRAPEGEWVLRHYRRGGWAARVSRDSYVWLGAEHTRSFREWRLLAQMVMRGLPVPRPIAARFVRHGLIYRADLITERITAAQTLAQAVVDATIAQEHWRAVGRTIAAFHAQGVRHADLNANNILLGAAANADAVHVLDFDRGRFQARGAWEAAVLARLRRSLVKISRQAGRDFDERQWQWLKEGYRGR